MPLFENNIKYPVFNYITVLTVLNYLFDCLNLNVKSIKKIINYVRITLLNGFERYVIHLFRIYKNILIKMCTSFYFK